ncbi:MAG: PH domain-containing protein [Synergistaceae bacterium]|nr:PH domain-containing protein [Synergistaceae bacterium]
MSENTVTVNPEKLKNIPLRISPANFLPSVLLLAVVFCIFQRVTETIVKSAEPYMPWELITGTEALLYTIWVFIILFKIFSVIDTLFSQRLLVQGDLLIYRKGLLRRSEVTINRNWIELVERRQGIWQRLIGACDLTICTLQVSFTINAVPYDLDIKP